MKKKVADQIKDLENTRAAKQARMEALNDVAAEGERSLETAEGEEFDTLDAEIKAIDKDLVRLKRLQVLQVAKATPVAGDDADDASDSRGGLAPRITIQRNLPKGTGFTRYAMALARANGNRGEALEIAKAQFGDTPEVIDVLKAAVAAGTTTDATWALPLVSYTNLVSEFIELLRPATILGRLPGLRNVPFNVRIARQTGGGTYGWVGEGAAKPVGKLSFDEVTLRWAKAAGIIVLTEELVRQSSPAAEAIVRADMINGIAQFLDGQFIDPTVAAVSNVSPASITNGVTPTPASGTDSTAFRVDVATMWEDTFISQNSIPTAGVWIMSGIQAMRLSLILNPLGQAEYPGLTPTGGTLLGYPVIVANTNSDSSGSIIVFVNASDILYAEDGLVIDVSREASLQMNTTPMNPADASVVMVSLWQNNLVGLRAERFINWAKRRANAVGYISGANYGIGGT